MTSASKAEWKRTVYDEWREIDPSHEQDWYSLALGWALGKGATPADAHQFATEVNNNEYR